MPEATPNTVAAAAFSTGALPSLLEAMLFYAAAVKARVLRTLGLRGYRDGTTHKLGEATWLIDTAESRQV